MHVQHLPLLLGQEGGPVIPPLEVPLKNACCACGTGTGRAGDLTKYTRPWEMELLR